MRPAKLRFQQRRAAFEERDYWRGAANRKKLPEFLNDALPEAVTRDSRLVTRNDSALVQNLGLMG